MSKLAFASITVLILIAAALLFWISLPTFVQPPSDLTVIIASPRSTYTVTVRSATTIFDETTTLHFTIAAPPTAQLLNSLVLAIVAVGVSTILIALLARKRLSTKYHDDILGVGPSANGP